MLPRTKCVFVGDKGVGKTCLIISSTTGAFPGEYIPSRLDSFLSNRMVDGAPACLELWDSSDRDHEQLLFACNTNVTVVVFSLVSPVLLVGTKNDADRLVSRAEGECLAAEINAASYLECSALTQDGLKEVLDEIVRVGINRSRRAVSACSVL
eukprot:c20786_g2_i2.p3 GENE.c20786_g2_i2~~c20786_g2_i2.p3  ORF type:complete len:153 (+),score=33.34 c20786_g2_i2:1999-2457(+)